MAFFRKTRDLAALTAASMILAPEPDPLSAHNDQANPRRRLYRTPDEWQREAWDYYDSLGEFSQGVDWKSHMLSRVRLIVAKRGLPDADPVPVTSGPAVDIIKELSGGIGGQAQLMSEFGVFLNVPGECYLIGETLPEGKNKWYTRSIEEVIPSYADDSALYKVSEGRGWWRLLPEDSMVIRVWRAHKRWHNVATSPGRACRTILRELELINRHIQAQYLSRLASAGVICFPDEVSFPVRPEFADAPDPFVAEWIEIAAEAIRTPGTAASVIPIPIRVPAEYVDKIHLIDFTLKLDDHIIQKRDSALTRLALSMDMPPAALLGTRDVNHWCHDLQTEVLSRDRGWIREPQVHIGDELYSMDHDTGIADWRPVTDVYRAEVVDEPMVSIEGRFHSSLTTLKHRWPVLRSRWDSSRPGNTRWDREWTTSGEMIDRAAVKDGNSQLPFKLIRGAPSASIPTVAKYDDALVELVAWMFTEGSMHYRLGAEAPHQVGIYQSASANADNCARIRLALTKLYGLPRIATPKVGHPTQETEDRPWWREFKHHDETKFVLNKASAAPIIEHCPRRMVSNDFIDQLTHAQLLLFIDTAVRGDGSIMNGAGTRAIFQKDPQMLDAIERAGILAGYATNRHEHEHDGFHVHKMNWLTFSEHPEYRPRSKNLSEVSYTGQIWCPTVPPTHTVLIRRKGKVSYTGQSAWLIDEQGVKIHVAPDAELICSALTDGYLIPRLEAAGEDFEDLIVWYDASALILRPDKTKAATDAYDRGEISSSAYRTETGFGELDKPSDEELQRMTLIKIALTQPVNALAALKMLFPTLNVPEPAPVDAPRPDPKPTVPADPGARGVEKGTPKQPVDKENPPKQIDNQKAAAEADRIVAEALTKQAGLMHAIRVQSVTGDWSLLHPIECAEHLFECPVTHATWNPIAKAKPGKPGVYRCWLNDYWQPLMGEQLTDSDVAGMTEVTQEDVEVQTRMLMTELNGKH